MRLSLFQTFLASLVLLFLVVISFRHTLPSSKPKKVISETEFSMERALEQLEKISEKPHYVGSNAHSKVRDYLMEQLEALGLETHIQEGYVLNEKWNTLAKPQNILARIKGSESERALLLLAHYDSAPHSFSYGASDAGSGVVAILESVRAYLASSRIPKNDVIILFSDAEEIGLLGAKLFVHEHPWINEVALVVNFEARGSGGPSSMILETNNGNKNLVREFIKSKPTHPFASSLFYSIYQMLPNDTDSTVFREDADIESYFFAFIDDHFDYHTANDTFENLDRNSLQHQGTYATAILNYFTNSNLENLKSEEDWVYFNFPVVKMISYPFSWIFPMLLFAWALFLGLLLLGYLKRKWEVKMLLKGMLVFSKALVFVTLLAFFSWKLILLLYPEYNEILHGFTYNGSLYILMFTAFSLAWCFWFYRKFNHEFSIVSIYVFPVFIWLVINTWVAVYLKGAAYFIIPVYSALFTLFLMLFQTHKRPLLYLLLNAPALFLLVPLIRFFPVGLGLKMLFAGVLFTVLIFGLLIPVLLPFRGKKFRAFFLFLSGTVFFVMAHFKSGFSEEKPKPNSLAYFYNADDHTALWVTYDEYLDGWTKGFINKEENFSDSLLLVPRSKYETRYHYAGSADVKAIKPAQIRLHKDTISENYREIELTIIPNRPVNRLVLYTENKVEFIDFEANGKTWRKNPKTGKAINSEAYAPILNYYLSEKDSLHLKYRVDALQDLKLVFQEISFDLLSHPQFSIPKRPANQMPKPFINTDAIIVQQKIEPDRLEKEVLLFEEVQDSL